MCFSQVCVCILAFVYISAWSDHVTVFIDKAKIWNDFTAPSSQKNLNLHESWAFSKFNGEVKDACLTQASVSVLHRELPAPQTWSHTQTFHFHGAQTGCDYTSLQCGWTKLFVGCLMDQVHSAWVSERRTTCTLTWRAHMLPALEFNPGKPVLCLSWNHANLWSHCNSDQMIFI